MRATITTTYAVAAPSGVRSALMRDVACAATINMRAAARKTVCDALRCFATHAENI